MFPRRSSSISPSTPNLECSAKWYWNDLSRSALLSLRYLPFFPDLRFHPSSCSSSLSFLHWLIDWQYHLLLSDLHGLAHMASTVSLGHFCKDVGVRESMNLWTETFLENHPPLGDREWFKQKIEQYREWESGLMRMYFQHRGMCENDENDGQG